MRYLRLIRGGGGNRSRSRESVLLGQRSLSLRLRLTKASKHEGEDQNKIIKLSVLFFHIFSIDK